MSSTNAYEQFVTVVAPQVGTVIAQAPTHVSSEQAEAVALPQAPPPPQAPPLPAPATVVPGDSHIACHKRVIGALLALDEAYQALFGITAKLQAEGRMGAASGFPYDLGQTICNTVAWLRVNQPGLLGLPPSKAQEANRAWELAEKRAWLEQERQRKLAREATISAAYAQSQLEAAADTAAAAAGPRSVETRRRLQAQQALEHYRQTGQRG